MAKCLPIDNDIAGSLFNLQLVLKNSSRYSSRFDHQDNVPMNSEYLINRGNVCVSDAV
jgi:hypothetical protein